MKRILIQVVLVFAMLSGFAQKKEEKAPDNWFNLDPKKDKVNGIGTERAYTELLKNKKSNTVVVAVIDGGTDIYHEDLKDIIWTNEDEIPGNGIDDDKNGYVDDIHGWNFIGGHHPDSNVKEDTYELTRLYAHLNSIYGKTDKSKVSPQKKAEYDKYERVKRAFEEEKEFYTKAMHRVSEVSKGVDAILTKLGKQDPTAAEVENFKPTNANEEKGRSALLSAINKTFSFDMISGQQPDLQLLIMMFEMSTAGSADSCKKILAKKIEGYAKYLDYHLNPDYDSRKLIVHDNYEKITDISYGNNNVKGPNSDHGSHVAGIIAALRNNSIGMKGVADNVRIMVLRVVPDGDERDKDVANAIRYAADNGAKIINMSFGKSWSWNKKAVDEAAKYASDKDVLLVHAAGNDKKNLELYYNYPSDQFEGTEDLIPNWVEVGASSWKKGKLLPAYFSNYGFESVDVFAPGVDIYSTVPDSNKYEENSGTSMAAPVTAGAAALIRSYYPKLTAAQVKEILMLSVTPVKGKVNVPGKKEKAKMKMLCKSGGVINVYNALILAETYK